MLSILQIHLHMYVLDKNILKLYFWYAKLVYLKLAYFVLKALELWWSSAEVQLKIYLSIFNHAKVGLLQYFWYTSNVLHLKTDIIQRS